MQIKDWSAIFGTWVSIAAAITGGYFALHAYRADIAKRADGRTEQTLALFQIWEGQQFVQLRQDILHEHSAREQEILAFVDFFDMVDSCNARGLCDAHLSEQIFGPYVHDAYCNTRQWVLDFRSSRARPSFGAGLERLAGQTQCEAAAPPADAAKPDAEN